MDDETQAPAPAQDDDLLSWVPPELAQRAQYAAAKDAGVYQSKRIMKKKKEKRADFKKPPAGSHRELSLAFLLGGATLLVLGTILVAAGANGQQAVLDKTRLGFGLELSGRAALLCVYLLFLLPLRRETRRPALFTMMGALLLFNGAASWVTTMRDSPVGFLVAGVLLTLLLTPETWLLLGLARRKTSEKLAAVMGCGILFIIEPTNLAVALATPEKAQDPVYIIAMRVIQGACYIALLFTWPVLDRPVLAGKPENIDKGDTNDGQPE